MRNEREARSFRLVTYLAVVLLTCLSRQAAAVVRMVPEEFGTIQAAADAANGGDTLSIAAGTYRGPGNRDIDLREKALLIRSREGPERTTVDCERLGRGFYLENWGFTQTATIEGLSVINAKIDGTYFDYGGGLFVVGATVTIKNCTFASCEALGGGAGFLLVATLTFEDCRFLGNEAGNQGGGAIWFTGGSNSAIFRRCVFTGNVAWNGYGGAFFSNNGPVTFEDCTITGNMAFGGGGMEIVDSDVRLERTICRDNCSDYPTGEEILSTGSVTIRCSDVDLSGIDAEELILEEGVIDADPLFCDPQDCGGAAIEGDYRIRSDSPCLPDGNPCVVLIGALGVGCQAPSPTGACCLPDGDCTVVTQAECTALGGVYQGDGSACDPTPCPPTPVETTTWGRIRSTFR